MQATPHRAPSSPILPYDPDAKPLSAQEWLNQPAVQGQIMAGVQGMVDQDALKAQLATALQGYVQTTMTTYMTAMASELQSQVTTALQQSMNQMANNMASAMSIDPDKFKDAFQMNMTEEDLGELMMSLMNTEEATYDNNLKKLGYADPDKPGGIDIYPIDFESKEKVIEHPRRLQRPHDGRRPGRQGHHLHRLRGHAHVLGHRHREHDQLRAGGVRGHLARGVVHHDRRHHLHQRARAQEGDRHPALHRREQGRHRPGVQRRDHHRGLHGRT